MLFLKEHIKYYITMFPFQGKKFTKMHLFMMLISSGSILLAMGFCFKCSLEAGDQHAWKQQCDTISVA